MGSGIAGRRLCRFLLIGLLLVGMWASVGLAEGPATKPAGAKKVKITISKATTYLTGPVNEDGTVNYVAAINEIYSKGVTRENNAAILLLKAVGPEMIDATVRGKVLEALGVDLPADGGYFMDLGDYVKATMVRVPRSDLDEAPLSEPDIEALDAARNKAIQQRDKAKAAQWNAEDYPDIAGWLKANEKPLELIVAASKRPRYCMPIVSSSQPPRMEYTSAFTSSHYLSPAYALIARAMLRLGEGDVQAAWEDVMTIHRLARLIGQAPTLMDPLFAIQIEDNAARAARAIAASGKLSAEELCRCLKDLQNLGALSGPADVVNLWERCMMLDCVMVFARQGGIKPSDILALTGDRREDLEEETMPEALVDWDLILRMGNHWYDRYVKLMAERDPTRRSTLEEQFERDVANLSAEAPGGGAWEKLRSRMQLAVRSHEHKRRAVSEAIGELLVGALMPGLGSIQVLHDQAAVELALTEISFALAAYKKEKGAYPDALAALVPGRLKKLPPDVLSGEGFIYKRDAAGYLLYSIGKNRKDDGGKGKDVRGADDIAVQVTE